MVAVTVPRGIMGFGFSTGEDEDEKLARLLSLAVANEETNFIFLPGEYGWLAIGRRRVRQAVVDAAAPIAIVIVGLLCWLFWLCGTNRRWWFPIFCEHVAQNWRETLKQSLTT